MKKILLIVLCVVLALSMVACGSSDTPEATENKGNTGKDSKYVFVVETKNNYTVKIDADMADVLAALGEPLSYFEAASCAFDGLDKTYTYAGFRVLTRPEGSKDYVNSIQLVDDSVQTPEGIYIGSTADDVLSKYGNVTKTDTLISYTDGNTAINFILKDGVVISIEYLVA